MRRYNVVVAGVLQVEADRPFSAEEIVGDLVDYLNMGDAEGVAKWLQEYPEEVMLTTLGTVRQGSLRVERVE